MKKLFLCFLVSLAFISCENFLENGDFQQQLNKDLSYAKAKEVNVLVMPEEGTGSTIPAAGETMQKLGYSFKIQFNINENYDFIKWKAVSRKNPEQNISGIVFENIEFSEDGKKVTADVTIKQTADDIRILPECIKKIYVDENSLSPKYDINGVSRDSAVIIGFTKNPAQDSFTSFKNISITNSAGYSLTDYFEDPVLNGRLLTIAVKKQFEFSENEKTKTIVVTLSKDITGADGSSMLAQKSWSYLINDTTAQKANLNFTCTTGAGDLSAASTEYNIGQTVNLEFKENDGWQFLYWDYDSDIICVNDRTSAKTDAVVLKETGTVVSTVKAVCIPRFRIESFTPHFSDSGVRCDLPVEITFNKPVDEMTVSLYTQNSNSGNIQIVNPLIEDEHFESFFTKAISEDKKTVTLTPKFTIHSLFESDSDLMNLKVKLNSEGIKDTDGYSLENDFSWTYRMNNNMETEPPEVTMTLYKPLYDGTEETDERLELSAKAFSEFSSYGDNDYSTNHIKNVVYFDASASDSGSGYKKLMVKETLVRMVSNTQVSITVGSDIIYTKEQMNQSDDAHYVLSKERYDLKSELDGVVQLDFVFEDNAGNTTVKTWYVIKDTALDVTAVLNPAGKVFDYDIERQPNIQTSGGGRGVSPSNGFYEILTDKSVESFEDLISDDSDKVTEEFDFSKSKDVFFYEKTSIVSYEVKYGYSEESITLEAEKLSDQKFSFERDVKRDCFVKISAFDSAGNFGSMMRVIPRQISIVDMVIKNPASGYRKIIVSDADTLNSMAKSYSALDFRYLFIFKYKASEDADFSDILRYAPPGQREFYQYDKINDFFLSNEFSDDYLTPDGIYYLYVIPYFRYSERNYYGAVSKTPYVFYHNVTPSENPVYDEPYFGEYEVTLAEAQQSTGMRNVSVSFGFEQTSDYIYGIRYNKEGSSEYKYAGLDFSVYSGSVYEVCLYAKNRSTGELYAGNIVKTVEATYDNIPPVMQNADDIYQKILPNHIVFSEDVYPYDAGEGLTENENGLKTFEYYIIKKDDLSFSHEISRADLAGLEPSVGEFSDYWFQLNFEQYMESYYILVFDLKDKQDNEQLYSFTVSNYLFPCISYASKENDSDYIAFWRNKWTGYDGFTPSIPHGYVFSEGIWKQYFYNGFGPRHKDFNHSQNNHIVDYSHTFVMFNRGFAPNGASKEPINGQLLSSFYSTDYLEQWIQNDEPPVCSSKAMIPAYSNSYQIFYDAPCLVHTMAWPTDKLSNLESKIQDAYTYNEDVDYETASAAVWATIGREFGCQIINREWYTESKNSTYIAPVAQIPSGYSYVTVCHFADGTSAISEVKHKK